MIAFSISRSPYSRLYDGIKPVRQPAQLAQNHPVCFRGDLGHEPLNPQTMVYLNGTFYRNEKGFLLSAGEILAMLYQYAIEDPSRDGENGGYPSAHPYDPLYATYLSETLNFDSKITWQALNDMISFGVIRSSMRRLRPDFEMQVLHLDFRVSQYLQAWGQTFLEREGQSWSKEFTLEKASTGVTSSHRSQSDAHTVDLSGFRPYCPPPRQDKSQNN